MKIWMLLLSFCAWSSVQAQSTRYELIPGTFTWNEAKLDAEKRGGHLATITSEEEWKTVVSLLGNDLLGVFLGGTDEQQEGVWKWITGEPWAFNDWAGGQPDNSSGLQDYLWLHPAYGLKWDDTASAAGSNSKYLLEIELPVPRYQIVEGSFSWHEAKLDGEKRGGHLATITSQQEWNAIRAMVPPSVLEGKVIWIGGTDSRIEGQWEWITGEPWGGFLNWRGGEPNNTGDEDFLELTQLAGSAWNDSSERERRQYYLLEFESNPRPPSQIEFVTVGDPENPPDSMGYGKVDYLFQIAKYEANNSQYAAFLNAKAKSDPHSLYDPRSEDRKGIMRSGNDGAYTYSVKTGFETKPVIMVNFYDVMRFANFLNNGGTETSDTETGAYDFGFDGSPPTRRNPRAMIFVPNENEWVKAAYYQPVEKGGPSGGYWTYATRSSTVPVAEVPPGGLNSANYRSALGGPYVTSEVGAYKSTMSYYGAFDQTGNVWEWNESSLAGLRGIRGGSSEDEESKVRNTFRIYDGDGAGWRAGSVGFRLARTFPPTEPPTSPPQPLPPLINAFTLARLAFGSVQGLRIPLSPPDRTAFRIETSTDLKTWVPLISFPTNSGPFEFIDSTAVSFSSRFYRAVKP